MTRIKIQRLEGFSCAFTVGNKYTQETRYVYVSTPRECAELVAERWLWFKYGYHENHGNVWRAKWNKPQQYRDKLKKRLTHYLQYEAGY